MQDADGGIGLVDVLTARAGRAVRVDLQILVADLDLHVLRLGQDRDGHGGGVDAPRRFRFRHALDAVHAAFKLERAVRALSRNGKGDLLIPAEFGGVFV